ncbi:hypothetical protein GQ457_07G044900 [Hibiscus cannabinus]
MMIGESIRLNPTIRIPAGDLFDCPMDRFPSVNFNRSNALNSPCPGDYLASLHRCLPSNGYESDSLSEDSDSPVDAFSCDHFRMFEFKVRRCARGRSHDWTECPYAHPGEKARRRDPRKFHYSGTACPDFRKGNCKRGDSCEFAHGVFECWLHPARYRTALHGRGKKGCFFAQRGARFQRKGKEVIPWFAMGFEFGSTPLASLSPCNDGHLTRCAFAHAESALGKEMRVCSDHGMGFGLAHTPTRFLQLSFNSNSYTDSVLPRSVRHLGMQRSRGGICNGESGVWERHKGKDVCKAEQGKFSSPA